MASRTLLLPLVDLFDPESGRLDAQRIAAYIGIPLAYLAAALGKNYRAVHKTPAAPTLQAGLAPVKRALDILAELGFDRDATRAWFNNPLPQFASETPAHLLRHGRAPALTALLEDIRAGLPD